MKHLLWMKNDAKPVFHRPRSILYAIKESIKKELARLEGEGIIEKVVGSIHCSCNEGRTPNLCVWRL